MRKWSAHMLTGFEKMTRMMRLSGTCRTDEGGQSCRRVEVRDGWRVVRFAIVALMTMVFGLVGFVGSVDAAISIESSAMDFTADDSATTLNWNQTVVSSTDTILIVGVNWDDRDSSGPLSATYGGTAMNSIRQDLGAGTKAGTALFYLTNPPTGTAAVIISHSGTEPGKSEVGVSVVLTGVDQSTPIISGHDAGQVTGGGSGISQAVTSANGEMVLSMSAVYKGTGTLGASEIILQSDSSEFGSSIAGGMSYKVATSGSETMTWSWSSDGGAAAISVVSLNPAVSCVETANVNAVDPGVITAATAITATLGGSGGSAPQVRWSTDGGAFSTWQASGATYAPPAGATGTVDIEAQATGFCGTITDPTPVNTTYDTLCVDPDPSTITIPAGQTAFGDGYDASQLITTTGDPAANLSLQYQITQQQTTPGTPFTVGPVYQAGNAGAGDWPGETDIDNSYPATVSGTIDTIDVYLTTAVNGSTLKFFTATISGTTVTPTNVISVTVNSSTAGDFQFTGLSLPIAVGEYLGAYGGSNGMSQVTSGDNMLYLSGADGTGGQYTGTNYAATLNLQGSGTTAPTVGEVTCTNWTGTAAIPTTTAGGSLCGDYANGSYILYSRGTDPDCATPIISTPVSQPFTWNSCTETKTLTLTPIIDPITGTVSVTATGTATGIQVGTTSATGNPSGWNYVPIQDDNTTTVSFYASGNGDCGTLTDSQLNVSTNTMAAPIITGFVADDIVDTAAPLEIPISTFTATDNVAVTGYMITESSTPPNAGDAGWLGSAPATYTVPAYGTYTLYAWAKDAAGNVSTTVSSTATVSNCTPTGSVSLDALPNPITGTYNVTATVSGGATAPQISVDGVSYSNSPYSYTPPAQSSGTQDFWAKATDGTCATDIFDSNNPTTANYDTRTAGIEAGTATAIQTTIDTISVTMPYLGDVNGDATFQVDYKLASSGSWINGTPTTDTGGSPYTENLTGLISNETYDVRVTYADPDGIVSGSDVQTFVVVMVPWADNAMLHNSNRFPGTTKHGGTWGTPGNYAGGITCGTCHDKNTSNIKKVRALISFADGGTMPGGGNSAAISLQTVVEGSSDFGDDSTAPRASSNRVCEACHTADLTQAIGVKQHAADQVADSGHFNNADCISCHEHKRGFEATCDSCHGNPPINNTSGGPDGLDNSVGTGSDTAGKHDLHANTLTYTCTTCHNGGIVGGEMPNGGNINIGFANPGSFGSNYFPGGNYDGRPAGSYFNDVNSSITTGDTRGCSSLYCHGTAAPTWTDIGTAVCGTCHGDATGMPSTVAGDGDLSGATTGKKVGKHPEHIAKGYSCNICHENAGDGTALHVDGVNDIAFNAAQAGASASYNFGSSTCSNIACHTDQVWDTATTATCDMCHGYPPTASSPDFTGATNVDHTKFSATGVVNNHSECNTCHGFSDSNGATDNTANGGDAYLASYHQDGNIEMNGWATDSGQDAQYQEANFGCAKACHGNDAAHQLSDSTLTVQLHRYGGGACDGCHNGTGAAGSATLIDATSPHSINITGFSCEDCHTAHGSGTIEIPNNPTVGINYSANGESGISLGSAVATGATEAEICWNCHDGLGTPVSEWGLNTDNNGIGANFDFGSLNTSNWTTATWTSANFTYKTGRIQSTHSVSSAGSSVVVGSLNAYTEAPDAVANIRCSYCHDVHDLNVLASDNSSGKPYLRGTWQGNPYKEDGAPQAGTNYTNSNLWGVVPRGSNSTAMQMGGYWIDQNTTNTPASMSWTLANSAGICTVCHGTNVDAMDIAAGGGNGGNEGLWVGTNGHSNAVLGGTGSAKFNVFDARGGTSAYGDNPLQHYSTMTDPADNGSFGFRSENGNAHNYTPAIDPGNSRPRMFDTDNWAVDESGATTQTQYHQFSCSKCHNPHASRLPKLMISNCLDTKHNTWDDSYQQSAVGSNNTNRSISNWTSSQNCHRLGGIADGSGPPSEPVDPGAQAGVGNGWNKITPWRTVP